MGKKSRDMGKYGELRLRDELRKRGWDYSTGRQHSGSPDSPDVKETPGSAKGGVPRIHWEAKFGYDTGLNVEAALRKVSGESPEGFVPVVAWKKKRKPWLVVLSLDDFLNIVDEWDWNTRVHEYTMNPPTRPTEDD